VKDTRELYEQRTAARLDEWQAKMQALKAKTTRVSADAQIGAREQLEKLHDKSDEMKEKLKDLKSKSSDNWEDAKQHLESSMSEFETALKGLISKDG